MTKEKQVIIQCPACNGTGDGPNITREMALDGGCPEMEGTPSFCLRCGGSGVDVIIDCFHDEIDEMYEAKKECAYDDAEEMKLVNAIKKESEQREKKNAIARAIKNRGIINP